jgi:hypothetical protein
MITLRRLDTDTCPSFDRLLAILWEQNWPDSVQQGIVRWRYRERPSGHLTWLACDGDECVAMMDSRVSPHALDGHTVMVRETADWFCLPEYRQQLLGLRLLRQMQASGEPILVIGGSDANRSLLSRLHWKLLPPVCNYILPVTLRGLAANLLRQTVPPHEARARLMWRRLPCRPPRRLPPPSAGAACEVVPLQPDEWFDLENPRSSGLTALLERAHWQWLNAMPPDFARPLALLFRQGTRIIGVSLSQLEPAAAGLDARILHVQPAREDAGLLAWMFAETAAALVARGAEFIRCRVSTPEKTAAIEAVGFKFSQMAPCFWWSKPSLAAPAAADVGYLRGDDALPLLALRGRRLAAGELRQQRVG